MYGLSGKGYRVATSTTFQIVLNVIRINAKFKIYRTILTYRNKNYRKTSPHKQIAYFRISRPHVETFWESWDMTHNNYGSNLSALPVVPIGE